MILPHLALTDHQLAMVRRALKKVVVAVDRKSLKLRRSSERVEGRVTGRGLRSTSC